MVTKIDAGNGKVRVTFCIPAAIWADTVHVVGSFNNWSQTLHPLHLDDTGWHTTLELEAGRSYEYRYLINSSEWHNDWHADHYVPNEYGGDNSVVDLSCFGDYEGEHDDLLHARVVTFTPRARVENRRRA
jgi:1,4-alpha-glucan branching enzyme